ncbi:MAG: capsule assembly Wzi family protein, partial [Candidatus Deferrimicrobiaceae bacterium]
MRSRTVGVLVGVLLVLPTLAPAAGPEIFLRDEPEAYVLIDKLQGLGLLPGLMTGTRGLEAREVALEAGKEEQIGDPFVDGMLRFLRLGGARNLDFRIGGGLGYSNDGYVPPKAQGVPVPDGAGYRVNGFFRAAPYSWLGVQARAEAVAGNDGERTGRIGETSLRLGWPQATLEAGRFAVWYGPGRHGALIFTTNAEPMTGVRIRNPRP